MDNWENLLSDWLENSTKEFDSFCQQLNQDWQESSLEFKQNLDDFVNEIETIITEELIGFLNELDDLLDFSIDSDFTTTIEIENENEHDSTPDYSDYIVWFEEPILEANTNRNPACIGCRNYHGRVYSGNLLVCAIHPYGWSDDNCPDWETDNRDKQVQ